jgi:hypothetical protein
MVLSVCNIAGILGNWPFMKMQDAFVIKDQVTCEAFANAGMACGELQ